MAPNRCYFVIAACMSEDWVNAPSMWECCKKAMEAYTAAGIGDRIAMHFHREGHAVLAEDAELFLPYFDMMYGRRGSAGDAACGAGACGEGIDVQALQTSVFAGQE
jgi:hypothetical protein